VQIGMGATIGLLRPQGGWESIARCRRCVTPKLLLIEPRLCVGPGSGVRDAITRDILMQ